MSGPIESNPADSSSLLADFQVCRDPTSSPSDVVHSLERLLATVEGEGRLDQLPVEIVQQLLTLTLQAQVTNAGVPSTIAIQAHHQKLLVERLRACLLKLSPSPTAFDVFDQVVRAHTLIGSSLSRRNSLTPSVGSKPNSTTSSRRNSLVPPVEDETIASIRLGAFKFIFQWARAIGANLTSSPPSTESVASSTCHPFLAFNLRIHLRSLADVWSAIRKAGASDLSKKGGLIELLLLASSASHNGDSIEDAIDQLLQLAGIATPTVFDATAAAVTAPSTTRTPIWQQQEGAFAGLASLFQAIRASSRPIPSSVRAFQPNRLLRHLTHPQLTVREFACASVVSWIELLKEKTSVEEAEHTKAELIHQLFQRLEHGMETSTTHTAAMSGLNWLSDYESEGFLALIHQLDLPVSAAFESHLATLDHYLAHPASSVRQLVSEILCKIASSSSSAFASASTSASSSAPQSLSSPFSLIAFLAGGWNWSTQESQARIDAIQEHTLTDVHAHAVYFVIPPPISIEADTRARSRRASFSHKDDSTIQLVLDAPPPMTHVVETGAASGQSSPRAHRSSWQWKEGAFMSLESYLRTQPSPSHLCGLDAIFPHLIRAALSWCWELRRMAHQLLRLFIGAWFGRNGAGREVVQQMQQMMTPPLTATDLTSAHPTIEQASCVAIGLHACLAHLYASSSAPSASSSSSTLTGDDVGVDRKWHSDDLHIPVDSSVRGELACHASRWLDELVRVANAPPPPDDTHSIITGEQFVTLVLQTLVVAYGTIEPMSKDDRTLRSSHLTFLTDRMRLVTHLAHGSATPSLSSSSVALTDPTGAKMQLVLQSRARRLQAWWVNQTGQYMHAFVESVTRDAKHTALLALLRHFLVDSHSPSSSAPSSSSVTVDLRTQLLRSLTTAWSSEAPLVEDEDASITTVTDETITALLKFIDEQTNERRLVVQAIQAIVANVQLGTEKLKEIMHTMASLVKEECKSSVRH